MRILALVHRVPFPPNKGDKIRAFHELKYLAGRGHAIDLGTFADVEEDRAWKHDLLRYCRDVAIIPKDRRLSRAWSVLALTRRRPLSVGYFDSVRMKRQVARWLAERDYDAALCYSSPMAEYVRTRRTDRPRMARVMDFVDVDSDKWRQYAKHVAQPMKTLYRFEARALAAYERAIAEEFDASTFVSGLEVEIFRKIAPAARRVVDVPNGVDSEYFGATSRNERAGGPPILVFVGQMDYFANVDAVRYFAREVFPLVRERVPDAEFRIVGRAPTAEVKALGERPGVVVTGAVPDIREHLAAATLMVAPLRIARGIQNKVLEGMAARMAVVASPEAMEGIEAQAGMHALVCADPASYRDAIVALVHDLARREALASAARALVVSKYAWESSMRKLEQLVEECARDHQA